MTKPSDPQPQQQDAPERVYLPLEVANAMSADAPPDTGDVLYIRAVAPTPIDLDAARQIVKRFGVNEGLFKGPRTLNAVEAIAQALADTRATAEAELTVESALKELREMFPGVPDDRISVRCYRSWFLKGKNGLVWSANVAHLMRQGPTLSDAINEVRAWSKSRAQKEVEGKS